jgi:hypothetical protein
MKAGTTRAVALGIGAVVVIVAGIVAISVLAPGDTSRIPPGLTEVTDPASLEKMLEMSRLGILTSTNYLGHRVYTVRATLKNISSMPIRLVDVKLTFMDYDKKPIQEEIRSALDPKQKSLLPGADYQFEIAFENPPRTWNYRVPDTHVVRVAF